jgi:hypothetical protein
MCGQKLKLILKTSRNITQVSTKNKIKENENSLFRYLTPVFWLFLRYEYKC